jgi:hypothetical protein
MRMLTHGTVTLCSISGLVVKMATSVGSRALLRRLTCKAASLRSMYRDYINTVYTFNSNVIVECDIFLGLKTPLQCSHGLL